MSNKYYQLTLSLDPDFQSVIDTAYSRLALMPTRRDYNGKRINIRASKKRIAHSGVMMLDELSTQQLKDLSDRVVVISKDDAPDITPKHVAIQMDMQFSKMARLKSASTDLRFNLNSSTKAILHHGIVALSEATDDVFQRVVRSSINIENGAGLRKYAFYDTLKLIEPDASHFLQKV